MRYFGYEANGQLILRGQLAYRTKYPHRLFVVKEIGQVEKGEGPVYTAIVKLDYWLANPEKENDMDYDEPEGEIAQKISFAFGEGGAPQDCRDRFGTQGVGGEEIEKWQWIFR